MADVRCFADCETISKLPVIPHTTLRDEDSTFSLVNGQMALTSPRWVYVPDSWEHFQLLVSVRGVLYLVGRWWGPNMTLLYRVVRDKILI